MSATSIHEMFRVHGMSRTPKIDFWIQTIGVISNWLKYDVPYFMAHDIVQKGRIIICEGLNALLANQNMICADASVGNTIRNRDSKQRAGSILIRIHYL